MKKLIVSLLFIGAAAIPAQAASKMKAKGQRANIDHSKDVALSAQWADQAVSPQRDADFTIGSGTAARPYVMGKTMYYGLNNFTLHGATAVNMNAPYEGGDAPSYDGAARNAYRNMRANNESEPLAPNDGSRARR